MAKSIVNAPYKSAAQSLRMELEKAGISTTEFATTFGVRAGTVQNWMTGRARIPGWVMPTLQIFNMLTPAGRRRFLKHPKPRPPKLNASQVHPFARIEEL